MCTIHLAITGLIFKHIAKFVMLRHTTWKKCIQTMETEEVFFQFEIIINVLASLFRFI